jgi:hypothetical protein
LSAKKTKIEARPAEGLARRDEEPGPERADFNGAAVNDGRDETLAKEPAELSGRERRNLSGPAGGLAESVNDVPTDLPPDLEEISVSRALEDVIEYLATHSQKSIRLWTKAGELAILEELRKKGFTVARGEIRGLLAELGYIRQPFSGSASAKALRAQREKVADEQNGFLSAQIGLALKERLPVISLATKKVEPPFNDEAALKLVDPVSFAEVRRHGGQRHLAIPLESWHYERVKSPGPAVVDSDLDEAAFALESLLGWWDEERARRPPVSPDYLLLIAHGGTVHGYGAELWQTRLQALADYVGRPLRVCHAHRPISSELFPGREIFSFLSTNWRGQRASRFVTTAKLLGQAESPNPPRPNCWVSHARHDISRDVSQAELSMVCHKPLGAMEDFNYVIYNQGVYY